jgi:hypothetical protein
MAVPFGWVFYTHRWPAGMPLGLRIALEAALRPWRLGKEGDSAVGEPRLPKAQANAVADFW